MCQRRPISSPRKSIIRFMRNAARRASSHLEKGNFISGAFNLTPTSDTFYAFMLLCFRYLRIVQLPMCFSYVELSTDMSKCTRLLTCVSLSCAVMCVLNARILFEFILGFLCFISGDFLPRFVLIFENALLVPDRATPALACMLTV